MPRSVEIPNGAQHTYLSYTAWKYHRVESHLCVVCNNRRAIKEKENFHTVKLPQGIFNVNIAIKRYRTEVEYRWRWAHHVECDPSVTEFSTEDPISCWVCAMRLLQRKKKRNPMKNCKTLTFHHCHSQQQNWISTCWKTFHATRSRALKAHKFPQLFWGMTKTHREYH